MKNESSIDEYLNQINGEDAIRLFEILIELIEEHDSLHQTALIT